MLEFNLFLTETLSWSWSVNFQFVHFFNFFSSFSILIFSTEFPRRRLSARVATSSNFPQRSRLETFEIQYFLFNIYWYLWYRIFINQVEDFTLLVEDCHWIVIHDILVCSIDIFNEERIELKCKLLKICCFPVMWVGWNSFNKCWRSLYQILEMYKNIISLVSKNGFGLKTSMPKGTYSLSNSHVSWLVQCLLNNLL